jgi:ribonuclease III
MFFKNKRNEELIELEKKIGYRFKDVELLNLALVHKSLKAKDGIEQDNQRLEFLGDAALSLVAAHYFFKHYPKQEEGILTALRSQITSKNPLAKIARDLKLGQYLNMSTGEAKSGGRNRVSTLEDTLEAIIGAAFVDGGLKGVEQLFNKVFVPVCKDMVINKWSSNPKGRLQEYSLNRWQENPDYTLLSSEGPDHEKQFSISVSLNKQKYATGVAKSKQKAESMAAQKALEKLEDEGSIE